VIEVSKGEIKARALAYFRHVEETGEPVVITDRGKPVLEVRRYLALPKDPESILRNSVLQYPEDE